MIGDALNQKIAEALKAHDEVRLSTLRLLASALNYEFIAKQHRLSEEEELTVVWREAKKRKEAIAAYEKAGARDRAEREKKELAVLTEFLPAQLSDTEVNQLIDESINQLKAASLEDVGKVMGLVMTKIKGRADGGKVAAIVRSKLQNLS